MVSDQSDQSDLSDQSEKVAATQCFEIAWLLLL